MDSFRLIHFFLVLILLKVNKCENSNEKLFEFQNKHRKSRALLFPISSAIGMVAALAIPLDLPNRNVFYSYNFEANYNLPSLASDFLPGPLERLDLVDGRNLNCGSHSNDSCPDSTQTGRKQRMAVPKNYLSRKTFYNALIEKFAIAGYNGKDCLRRMICEVNAFSIGEHNGVFGSILQIIFSPSLSEDEGLHYRYYEAEQAGLRKNCKKYEKNCKQSLLDLITKEF